MQIIISPTKTMQYHLDNLATEPLFLSKSLNLVKQLQNMSVAQLQKLLKVNEKTATLNYQRYQNFQINKKSLAIYTYTGLQYKYFNISQFNPTELNYLNTHVRILSAFYGLLKPFDGIDYYRLVFNNTLKLYTFWHDLIYQELIKNDQVIINLASNEYAKLVTQFVQEPILLINIHFKEYVNNKLVTKATNAKMARGLMLAYIVKNQITDYHLIQNFQEFNYRFDEQLSNENNYIFIKNA